MREAPQKNCHALFISPIPTFLTFSFFAAKVRSVKHLKILR